MSSSSIWPLHRILSSATTPGQSEPGSDSNEGVLHIRQGSSYIGASPSDCLMSQQEQSLVEGPYSSSEVQVGALYIWFLWGFLFMKKET